MDFAAKGDCAPLLTSHLIIGQYGTWFGSSQLTSRLYDLDLLKIIYALPPDRSTEAFYQPDPRTRLRLRVVTGPDMTLADASFKITGGSYGTSAVAVDPLFGRLVGRVDAQIAPNPDPDELGEALQRFAFHDADQITALIEPGHLLILAHYASQLRSEQRHVVEIPTDGTHAREVDTMAALIQLLVVVSKPSGLLANQALVRIAAGPTHVEIVTPWARFAVDFGAGALSLRRVEVRRVHGDLTETATFTSPGVMLFSVRELYEKMLNDGRD